MFVLLAWRLSDLVGDNLAQKVAKRRPLSEVFPRLGAQELKMLKVI